MRRVHTWTRSEWVDWWGDGSHELRDLLWSIMVDTHKRLKRRQRKGAKS